MLGTPAVKSTGRPGVLRERQHAFRRLPALPELRLRRRERLDAGFDEVEAEVLPDAVVQWRYVWIGAAVTSLLFVVGKFLIGFYIGQSDPGSAYGAAGSRIVVRVSGRAVALPGDRLRVVAKAEKLHWFDGAGKRVG